MDPRPNQWQKVAGFLHGMETVRRRDILVGFLPAFIGVILLGYAMVSLYGANQEIFRLQQQAESLGAEVERVQNELRVALIHKDDLRRVDGRDVRALRRHSPRAADVLQRILELKTGGVAWASEGADVEKGFDSPSFVSFILREMNLTMGYLKLGDDPYTSSSILFQNLRYVEKPELGDLVFYPAGYVFFYFQDRRGRPFVIGMTPLGVRALDPRFAEPIGFRNFWFAGTVN